MRLSQTFWYFGIQSPELRCHVPESCVESVVLVLEAWAPGGVDSDRGNSLVSNGRTSSFPGLRILFYGDGIVPAAPQRRNSGPMLGPVKFPVSSGFYRVVTGPQCQPYEKRPLYIWYKASARRIHGARNMLSSGCRAGKWHFNTNSLSCQPHPQGFCRLRGTCRGLSFPPLVSPDVKRYCSGEQPEKSPILLAPPHLPRRGGLQVPGRTEELPGSVRPFTLVEKWPPLCQVPTLAAPSMGSHEQHLSA